MHYIIVKWLSKISIQSEICDYVNVYKIPNLAGVSFGRAFLLQQQHTYLGNSTYTYMQVTQPWFQTS